MDAQPAGSGGPPLVEARGVAMAFGSVVALRDATVAIRPNEVVAVVGENGAGKSTFVKILAGLHRPVAGELRVDGRPIGADWSPARSAEAGIAVVQQELSIVPTLTVAENLFVGDRRGGRWWSPRARERAAGAALAQVGLNGLDPATVAGRLPVSTQQLVEIARTLTRDARLIIMDEPTASLGDDEIHRVKQVVGTLAAGGRSVVYVSHRLEEIFEIADRVVVFRDGRSQEAVATRQITPEALVERMIGKPMTALFPPAGRVGARRVHAESITGVGLAEPVSLEIGDGEILGLVGQTGSGAAALLRLLGGSPEVDGGALTVDGTPVSLASRRSALRGGVAYCSPDRKRDGMFAGLTVAHNVTAPGLRAVSAGGFLRLRRERAVARDLATRFTVAGTRMDHLVGTLSGGNQQKVVLAKWLAAGPRLLLVDEPTRGVDIGARAEIYHVLRSIAGSGTAIVVASSDIHEVLGLADRVLSFYRGRVVGEHRSSAVSAADVLREVTHPAAVPGEAS